MASSVTNALFLPQNFVAPLALANPLGGADHELAKWFHERLTPAFVAMLHAFTDFGSGEWIGIVVFALVLFFAWKRWWPSLVTLIVAVPGGMLLNEWVKILVHRQRPFLDGPSVDWSGYSFASGHTVGATLLYGQLLPFILPLLKARHWRLLSILSAISLVALVGFSRIALGAHFLTDVLAAVFLELSGPRFVYLPQSQCGDARFHPLSCLLLANLLFCGWNWQRNPRKVSRANQAAASF